MSADSCANNGTHKQIFGHPQPNYNHAPYQYDRLEAPIITCNVGPFNKDRDRDSPVRITQRRATTPIQNAKDNNPQPGKVQQNLLNAKRPGSSCKTSDILVNGGNERNSRNEKKVDVTRIRSVSAGRDRKSEMTSRYWAYLFENLERAFSEIYSTCHKHENVLQCKEVLSMLENYTRDFNKLIEWLNKKWNYEKTPPPLRTNALNWEIRKSSFCIVTTKKRSKILPNALEKLSAHEPEFEKTCPDLKPEKFGEQNNRNSVEIKQTVEAEPVEEVAINSHGSPTVMDNEDIPVFCVRTVDIGIQTDFEEDPDVYYFAGGREIASQTDLCDQYGPLIPFSYNTTPVIIVLNTTDSDVEISTSTSENIETNVTDVNLQNSNTPIPISVTNREVELDVNSSGTSIETKSSATQLSEGVIIDESAQQTGTSDNDNGRTENQPIESISENVPKVVVPVVSEPIVKKESAEEKAVKNVEKSAAIDIPSNSSATPVVKPTTFADKAKNGMLRQAQTQAKSFPGNLNKIGYTPPSSANSGSGKSGSDTSGFLKRTKGNTPGINYRSNIASRCRTAVNTGQQRQVSPIKPKHSPPCTSTTVKLITHVNALVSNTATLNSNASTKPNMKDSSSGHGQMARSSNKCPQPTPPPHHRPLLGNSKQSFGLGTVVPEKKTVCNNSPVVQRFGVGRSKSMINPQAQHRSKTNVNGNKKIDPKHGSIEQGSKEKLDIGKSDGAKDGNPFQRSNSNSLASLPDESCNRKRNSIVDEDGWETVRARSSRSKWSPVDDDEIKRKEDALDNAIREEELLEEELLQVEKDFEMIEKEVENDQDVPDHDIISENETAPSPDILDVNDENDDPEKELEQFFFISMNGAYKGEEFTSKEPGRCTLREKLMSPAKRCDGAETLRKQQAKLANAERNREKLLQSKFNRYVELSERFESLNETTKRLYEERTELIAKAEDRRKRAAEKRKQYLKDIVRKAHDEDSKAKEIAFINNLEAQNRRHDYFASAQEVEERLQTMHEERKLKLEERATKASAVIERQFRIRNGWQGKLESIQEKRRKAEERITREKEERAKGRSELAQEKARDREERISALNAAKQAEKEELQKKIIQKQEIHARRHEENMEHIRQKAIELSVPRMQEESPVPSSVRMCTLCKVTVQSEVQELAHLRGRAHLDAVKKIENLPPSSTLGMENFGLKFITDVQLDKIDAKVQVDKNRFKTLKKQCRKLKQKMTESGQKFEENDKNSRKEKLRGDPSLKSKIQKIVKEVDRLLGIFNADKGTPAIATSMDRLMGEIRKNCIRNNFIQEAAVDIGAVAVAQRVLECTASDLPTKVLLAACHLLVGIIYQNLPNTLYVFRSTCICAIMDLCINRWNALIPDGNRWLCGSPVGTNEPLPSDSVIESVMELLFNVINVIPDPFVGITKENILNMTEFGEVLSRTQDIIGYLVASGVIDRLSVYCSGVRGPVDKQPTVADLLKVSLDFLTVNIYALNFCWEQKSHLNGTNGHKREPDVTQLLAALESSELAGAVSMSYSLLLYQGAPTRPRLTPGCNQAEKLPPPPPPGERTSSVVKATLCLINAVARLDIVALQNVLGSEAVSLQFRHIASQLLWQVVPHRADINMRRLLNELVISVGNFTVANERNQVTIQSGQTPTVLQQLCSLPREFFTEPKLSKTIIPTLIAATHGCPENRAILVQQSINVDLLDTFLHSESGKLNCVTKRLLQTPALNPIICNSQVPANENSNKKLKKLGKTGSIDNDS